MNQQLRQLAEKAGIELTNGSYSLKVQADEGSLTEFAELIVQECVGLFNRPANQCTQFECMADDYATGVIKKHFGVEE